MLKACSRVLEDHSLPRTRDHFEEMEVDNRTKKIKEKNTEPRVHDLE